MDVPGGNEIITTIWGQIQRRRRTEARPGNPAGNSAPTDRQTDGRTITHWHTFRGAGCKGRDGHLGIVIARRVACVSVWTAAVCTVRRRDVTDPLRGCRVTSPIHRPRLFPRPPRLNCLEAGGSHTSGAVSVFVPAETRVSLWSRYILSIYSGSPLGTYIKNGSTLYTVRIKNRTVFLFLDGGHCFQHWLK